MRVTDNNITISIFRFFSGFCFILFSFPFFFLFGDDTIDVWTYALGKEVLLYRGVINSGTLEQQHISSKICDPFGL